MKEIRKKVIASMLLGSICMTGMPVLANTKEETVYTKLDNNSNVYSTIVSTKLSNDNKSELIEDLTDLMNIENTNGDEEFTQEGNKIIWKSQGKNIQYKGESKKQTPVTCKIKYELNGEEVEAKDIVGKNGKVKIIIEYENNEIHEVNINGKNVTMYTPFVMMAGTIIDKSQNENITITRGKILDNGTKSILIGIATPGLQESLGISKEKIEFPNSTIIEMETKNFEMDNIMICGTAKILEENDLNMIDDLDKIYNQANELKKASTQLVDGTGKVKDGTSRLNSGIKQLSRELNSEINLYERERNKYDSKDAIKGKIIEILNGKIADMLPDLEKQAEIEARKVVNDNLVDLENSTITTTKELTKNIVNEKLDELEEGKLEIPVEIENAILNDIKTIINNMEDTKEVQQLETAIKDIVVDDVKTILDSKLGTIKEKIEATKMLAKENPTSLLTKEQQKELEVKEQEMAKAMCQGIIENYYKDAIISGSMTQEQAQVQAYNQALKTVKENIETLITSTVTSTINGVENEINTGVSEALTEINSKVSSNKDLNKAIENYSIRVATIIKSNMDEKALTALENEIKKNLIKNIATTFENDIEIQGYVKQELLGTIDTIADKTATSLAKQYTKTLANEVATNLVKSQLSGENIDNILDAELSKYEGIIDEVDNGTQKLKEALKQLTDGSEQLVEGTTTLSEGMEQFDKEGISKIYDLVDIDVRNIEERIKELKKLAEQYNTFTQIRDEDKGEVSFITIIDSLKKEKFKKNEKAITSSNKINETIANETVANNEAKKENTEK